MNWILFKVARAAAVGFVVTAIPPFAYDAPPTTATPVLQPFNYTGVRLLDSYFKSQQYDILEYYLSVATDNYLIGFRKRAGKPAPGKELRGWYSTDTFNPFGQIVSGLARLYAATGDPRAKNMVDEMVAGFVDCIEPDGYHFYSRKTNASHYEFDKFLGGMLDAWLYCKNEKARDAIGPITDWAIKNLDPNPKYPQPKGQPNVEGYTLSENLYRVYSLTGEKKYLEFAQHWDYWPWWDKFETAAPDQLFVQPSGNRVPHYHGYSHVNSLNGLGAGYLATSDTRYLTRMKNAYDFLHKTQTYVTGGYAPMERITNRDTLEKALDWGNQHFETQCGSWAVFKLSKYLQTLTGDAHYAGWAEQMVYNGIGGTRQMDDNGAVQYFSNYSSRGATKLNINPWSCCTGTRPQAAADYTDQVFYHDEKDVYVSLFLASKLEWYRDGTTVSLKMETKFPAEETVRLTVSSAPVREFAINLRKPEWLASDAQIAVNREKLSIQADARNWYHVSRQWKAGDVLEVRLPLQLKWNRFNPTREFPGAVTYGPVALVWKTDQSNPATSRTAEQLISGLEKQGSGLSWKFTGDASTVVQPWYEVSASDKYYMYLNPNAGPYLALGSGWRANEQHSISHVKGSEAHFDFTGTGVRWHWTRLDDAGIVEVKIDVKEVKRVDQYGPVRNVEEVTEVTGLPAGKHRLTLTCTGEKNSASRAHVVNSKRFEIIN